MTDPKTHPPPLSELAKWQISHLLPIISRDKGIINHSSGHDWREQETKEKDIDKTRERPTPVNTPSIPPSLFLLVLVLPILRM
jgi:hypothetical protein